MVDVHFTDYAGPVTSRACLIGDEVNSRRVSLVGVVDGGASGQVTTDRGPRSLHFFTHVLKSRFQLA